mmetsp:Transcript_58556/g.122381  ORF Transcript_58556/g.122381 Transcript_58556/m.122381 type:complete len:111 (-) Transcript_58556:426-758(-)
MDRNFTCDSPHLEADHPIPVDLDKCWESQNSVTQKRLQRKSKDSVDLLKFIARCSNQSIFRTRIFFSYAAPRLSSVRRLTRRLYALRSCKYSSAASGFAGLPQFGSVSSD